MLEKSFELKSLDWDTKYFGVRSARVRLLDKVNDLGQDEIMNFCINYDFITIVNVNNISENNYWIGTKTNAFLVDINIQFEKEISEKPIPTDKNIIIINKLSRNEEILKIAKNSFKYSRFFNDLNIPDKKAENVYVHWTQSAFDKDNKYFVISEIEGDIAGYILFNITGDISNVELIAVEEKYRGKKIGKSLFINMESFLLNHGIKKIIVGTQINNIEATKFYTSIGFKFSKCNSLYHIWIGRVK